MNENTPALRSQQNQISVFSGASEFEAAQRMAKALCSSTLVPEIYRGADNIGNSMIALELANRTGASVLAVMQSMVPIHGKPSWSSAFLIATVNTCGRFTPLRFRFSGTEGQDDWGCRAVAKDKESGEELVGSLITIALAKAEGWHGKNGSKWKTMPEQMLTYRAAAFWTRAYAPEVSLGMHTAEEARDMVDVTPDDAKPKGQARTRPVTDTPAETVTMEAQVVPVSEPTPTTAEPEPAADPRDAFRARLEADGVSESQFLLTAASNEWFAGNPPSIAALTDEDIAWCRAKYKRVILPALKPVPAPAE